VLKRPFELDGVVVEVSGSVGVTYYPDHCRNMDQLLRFADMAMYKAKELRGEFMVFDSSLSPPPRNRRRPPLVAERPVSVPFSRGRRGRSTGAYAACFNCLR
jgi:hypothetical protein